MKIYTKTGDDGTTSLIGGKRVAKSDPQVEAYGTVDELIANIGLIITALLDNPICETLKSIQRTLISFSTQLANDGTSKTLPLIKEDSIDLLEISIDNMQERLPPVSSFILPGPPLAAAQCHVARTVCRRAERCVVALQLKVTHPLLLPYLNRLSDYLFVLSRYVTTQ
ncbi:MAG: cob(I)yrinic acid a,c-diamide adenosyltransferase [Prevotellaceae bacterium]|nr:cob(I)yrinic acid a,c-diamide adenosyltransferase [Prevotellaceae bacterium]